MKKESLFQPQNDKDLKKQFPELSDVAEFDKLTSSELLFVWWYSNPTSPLLDENSEMFQSSPSKRAEAAFSKSFKREDQRATYVSRNFPDKVRIAIARMGKFNASVRSKAKGIVEEILSNYEQMVKVDMSDFITNDSNGNPEINFTARNAYVNSCSKISDALPQIIRQVEEGFGLRPTKGAENKGPKAIDDFHSTKDQ